MARRRGELGGMEERLDEIIAAPGTDAAETFPARNPEHLRGRRLITADEAIARAEALRPEIDFGVAWGRLLLPSSVATKHFCVVGTSGSGKTMILRLLMQSCLFLIGRSLKNRPRKVQHQKEKVVAPSRQVKAVYEARKRRAEAEYESAKVAYESARKAHQERIEEFERARKAHEAALIEPTERKNRLNHQARLLGCGLVAGGLLTFISDKAMLEGRFANTPVDALLYAASGGGMALGIFGPLLGFALFCYTCRIRLPKFDRVRPATFADPEPVLPNIPEPPSETVTKTWETEEDIPYHGEGHRAFVYDAKGNAVSLLHAMRLSCPIIRLNPFDARSYAWDIAKDISDPAAAERMAAILIPEDKNPSQPFFANAARDLLAQVMVALMAIKPGRWTLRDVLLALDSMEYLKGILKQTPETRGLVDLYFSEERVSHNVMSELRSRTARYRIIAAAWHRAKEKFSLEHWLENEYIIVLGRSKKHAASLDPINRVLFERVTDLILSPQHGDSETRRTWFFLDEVRSAGKLESLGELMSEGRSKGVCVVLGFQALEGLHDAFGKDKANDFLAQVTHKLILRVNSPDTAEWASKLFGKCEFLEDETGESKGTTKTSGKTTTETKGTSESTTDGTTKGNSKGDTTGRTTGTTTGTSHGTSSGTSHNSSTGSSFGSAHSASSQSGWQSSEQRSEQRSTQESVQNSEQRSTQESESASESKTFGTSTSTAEAVSSSEGDSQTNTVNRRRLEKDTVLPAQFQNLPDTDPRNGLHGYYLVPTIGAFKDVLPGDYLTAQLISPLQPRPADPLHPAGADSSEDPVPTDYIERDAKEQRLTVWDETELGELNLVEASSEAGTDQSAKGEDSATAGESAEERKSAGSGTKTLRTNLRWLPESDPDNGLTRL